MLIGVLEVFAKLVVLWNHSPSWSGILYECVSGELWFHLNIHLLQDVFYHFLKVHQVLYGCSRTDADWTSGGPFGDSWLWLEKMLCTDGMCSYFCLLLTVVYLNLQTQTNGIDSRIVRTSANHKGRCCWPTIEVCMFLQACYRITNP